MIVEHDKNGVTVSNNSLDNQIADAEYYLLVAKLYGSKNTVNKWKRKIRKLKEKKEEEQNG